MPARLSIHQDIELHGAQICPYDSGRFQIVAFDGKLPQFGPQIIEVQTEIQHRANRHVAGDAGKAVEIHRLHGWDSNRKMRRAFLQRILSLPARLNVVVVAGFSPRQNHWWRSKNGN